MSYEPGASASRSASAILDAERITTDQLRLREESRLEVTLRRFRGKLKVWQSCDADGKTLVKEGTVLATGCVSPWMTRCSP